MLYAMFSNPVIPVHRALRVLFEIGLDQEA